ncbi:Histone H4 [Giardia duodenalis assemblage B]|uniref:Histone H4 n=2 Tax=Giardia intestinalis TaxID=5741 RepID=A0A132NQE5_GIAIN|nr:Histone H4 [Giardia intestinalis assemblage B]
MSFCAFYKHHELCSLGDNGQDYRTELTDLRMVITPVAHLFVQYTDEI